MTSLYLAGIYIWYLLIKIVSVFNHRARQFVNGRRGWKTMLKQKIEKDGRYIWVHCASLGEFEQGRPLIEEIRKKYPEYRILLTFFSPSGYEIRKNYEHAGIVMYLPVDTRKNAREFIGLVKPEKVFFIKYEYWYFYIDELKKKNIPLYMVSAVFRENQQFFKKGVFAGWYRKNLMNVEHFFVQNEESAELLQKAGLKNFTVSGDTRFDRVAEIARKAELIPKIDKFKNGRRMLIAGSTWKPDEEIITEFINKNSEIKAVIAPHEVTELNIIRLEKLLKTSFVRLSRAGESEINQYQVLIIDSVGILSSVYRYGDVAYIGGGFGVGIHNILEPATFGLPVIFGPNYKKFKEAADLIILGGAFSVDNSKQFEDVMSELLDGHERLNSAAAVCEKYIEKNVGATNLILKKVFNK